MSTRMIKELTYDAPLDEVRAMLLDVAFREQVMANQRVLSGEADINGTSVHIDMTIAAKGIPSYAAKFVGDTINIVQDEEWTDGVADVRLVIPGKPGQITGSDTLVERDGETVEVVELDIQVGIPLVGGKIEKLIAGILGEFLDTEHETGVAWLAS